MANTKIKKHSLQPSVNSEKIFNVLEKQVEEKATIYGRPCMFFKQGDVVIDSILLESITTAYKAENIHPMFYINDEDSVDMDGSMVYGGFNMIPLYSKIIYVPVTFFKRLNIKPQSNDLIYLPDDNQEVMLFEIAKDPTKEQDRNNTKNGRIFAYKLYLKLYSKQSGDETFETDFSDTELSQEDQLTLGELDAALDSLNRQDDELHPIPDTIQEKQAKKIEEVYKFNLPKDKGRFEDL